jgi:hypothetical protein
MALALAGGAPGELPAGGVPELGASDASGDCVGFPGALPFDAVSSPDPEQPMNGPAQTADSQHHSPTLDIVADDSMGAG